jgi:hypothetical protein
VTRDEHEAQLQATAWYTPQALAARWACDVSTVYRLSPSDLPYITLGRGRVRARRRYSPEAVAAFEAAGGVGRGAAA